MRLRAIALTNIRRFGGQTARVGDIGDGITVLSAPNETGKSTVFDALQAVFFEKHRSRAAPVKALVPHAGGAPEVAVEVELPRGRFRLAKRWISKPMAEVTEIASGRVIARDDEAEAWIAALIEGGIEGPSGLLWVRQGLLGLEPEADRAERARLHEARRSLMSSVAGEIDAVTGGRRMDAIAARVAAEFDRIATSRGRPKAGGPWAAAETEAEELAARRDALAARVKSLAEALAERRKAERELAQWGDPEAEAERGRALAAAGAALEAARAHAARLAGAEQALKLAEVTRAQAARDLAALDELAAAEARAGAARQVAAAARGVAETGATAAAQALETVEAARQAAQGVLRRAEEALAAGRQAQLAEAAAAQLREVADRLKAAEQAAAGRAELAATLATARMTAEGVQALRGFETRRDIARALAEQSAVTLRFAYDGAARASVGGREIGTAPLPLIEPAEIALPGIGTLAVDPGAGRDAAAALTEAEAALAEALARAGVADLAAAARLLDEAEAARAGLRDAEARLSALAPEGLGPLRQALERLQAQAGAASAELRPSEGAATLAERETALADARRQEAEILARAEQARRTLAQSREALAAARATETGAERQFEAVRAQAGTPEDRAGRRVGAETALATAGAAEAAARVARDELAAAAPDLATAQARFDRAGGVAAAAAAETARLNRRLAELEGRIGVQADAGIEQELQEVTDRHAAAADRAGRYAAEAAALERLQRALAEARRAAREAYFEPVLAELRPLLAILHPDARLELDDESLLPATLSRGGQQEGLEILSGGTREQIAVLTRLAFARLLARSGQEVPVILDDALVHSDDDRIEAMFTALHRVAADQQILVFTCRQRAFAALGGHPVELRLAGQA